MLQKVTHPPLEERFLQPAGWRWHHFENKSGRRIRGGSVMPSGNPDAIVVGLEGRSEFAEKWFEVAHDVSTRNLGFAVMDWQGQGKSDRYLPNPQKQHATSFDQDVADLHLFITTQLPQNGAPLIMLGHSMGGNVGLRYLRRHPGVFAGAALSAPMLGINDRLLLFLPGSLRLSVTFALSALLGKHYVPDGKDWHAAMRDRPGQNKFSSDPVRDAVHPAWYDFDPELQVGDVTYRWLYEAIKSCGIIAQPRFLEAINTPLLIAAAGSEEIVDNGAIRHAARYLPRARLVELEGARHEILMESDGIRDIFFNHFFTLVDQCKMNGSAPGAPAPRQP